MERTDDAIRAELVAAQAAYHALAQQDTASRKELAERSAKIVALRDELAALLSEGAQVCPQCNEPPLGHLKTLVAANAARGEPEKRTYEVRCVDCGLRSRGTTIRAAVLLWNAGEYVK